MARSAAKSPKFAHQTITTAEIPARPRKWLNSPHQWDSFLFFVSMSLGGRHTRFRFLNCPRARPHLNWGSIKGSRPQPKQENVSRSIAEWLKWASTQTWNRHLRGSWLWTTNGHRLCNICGLPQKPVADYRTHVYRINPLVSASCSNDWCGSSAYICSIVRWENIGWACNKQNNLETLLLLGHPEKNVWDASRYPAYLGRSPSKKKVGSSGGRHRYSKQPAF